MSLAAASDEDLMRRFAAGEARAFEHLYQRHELRVFRYLLRNVRNRALAEDLLQDIWFAVAQDAPRYEPTARFCSWLFTIAHHRMIDAFRTSRRQVDLELTANEADVRVALGGSATLAAPYAATLASEQLALLLGALNELPAEQRAAFLLQQEADLSVDEVASITGCSFETAKSRLRYARAKLRELLREQL